MYLIFNKVAFIRDELNIDYASNQVAQKNVSENDKISPGKYTILHMTSKKTSILPRILRQISNFELI